MINLDDADRVLIQENLDNMRTALRSLRLDVRIETDFADWVRHMENAPKITAVSPSFDPRFSHLHPGNSFWISIRDADGGIVACSCHRLFLTPDIRALIGSHKLFFDKQPVLDFKPVPIVLPREAPQIGGRVAYGGGYWLHPGYRGAGLSSIIPRMSRFLSLRHFEPDWNIALLKDTQQRRDMARDSFGVSHQVPCIAGYYPPDGRTATYQLAYMSAEEMLRQAQQERHRDCMLSVENSPGRQHPLASDEPALLPS